MNEKGEYTKIADAFFNLKQYEEAIKYYKLGYENIYNMAICYDELDQKELAIKYYEKTPNKQAKDYGNLARLYTDLYVFDKREEQLYYINKAYELNPNDPITLVNKLLIYCKFNLPEAQQVWEEVLPYKPKEGILFSYGCYLIHNKNFEDGFKLYRYRMNYRPEALPGGLKNIWNPNMDITDKTMLICYEQGYGDTLMFIRFLPYLNFKFKIVVQDELYELLKDLPYEIYPGKEIENIEYDYFIPIMDLPLFLNLDPDNLPGKKGYLPRSERKKNKKFKIGISYKGSEEASLTRRDVSVELFKPLLDLDVEVYSFQYGITEPEPIISLGTTFKDWNDTAKAMNEMDLIVTTDNGVLNLAGALGMPTLALFNRYPEFRWFYIGDDIGWYNIKPFQCKELDNWEEAMSRVVEEVKKKVDIFYK